jgi:hypothetical protein
VKGAYTSPVDNDYDIVYVWLNPVLVMSMTGNDVNWEGYGYDANDQNGLDVIAIGLGYLNGDFGPMPQQLQTSLNRAWATGQITPTGSTVPPALTNSDFTTIAAYDPFSNSSYGPDQIGSSPPSPNTPDGRFTMTECALPNEPGQTSEPFDQALPSQAPGTVNCTFTYSQLSTTAAAYTTSTSTTYSLDKSYSGTAFASTWSKDVKSQTTVTATTEIDSSISASQATSSALDITGLPCNNTVADEGPCVPAYPGPPTFPIQYYIYQDNAYGTFMFAPVDYY